MRVREVGLAQHPSTQYKEYMTVCKVQWFLSPMFIGVCVDYFGCLMTHGRNKCFLCSISPLAKAATV